MQQRRVRFRPQQEESTTATVNKPSFLQRSFLPEKVPVTTDFTTKQPALTDNQNDNERNSSQTEPEKITISELDDADELDEFDDVQYFKDPDNENVYVFPSKSALDKFLDGQQHDTIEHSKGTDYRYSVNRMMRSKKKEARVLLWHRISGHLGTQSTIRVAPNCKGMEDIVGVNQRIELPKCDCCLRSKSKRKKPKPKVTHRYREVMYRMHTDMSGRIKTKSIQGAHYFVVFVDDASGYKFGYLLRTKDEFLQAFDQLATRLGRHPKVLKKDNAGEMSSKRAMDYYQKFRVAIENCPPHEHEGNPRAESAIGTLSSHARAMMIDACAPKRFWGFALLAAVELENRFLPFVPGSSHTCWEAFYGTQPDNSDIPVWGCKAYVNIPKNRRHDQKHYETAISGVYIGSARHLGYDAHLVSTLDGKRIYISKYNVAFDNNTYPWKDKNTPHDTIQLHGGRLEDDDEEPGTQTTPQMIFDADTEETSEAIAFTEERHDRMYTRSQARALEEESMQQERVQRERARVQAAESSAEQRQIQQELPEEQQGAFDKAEAMLDEMIRTLQKNAEDRRSESDQNSNDSEQNSNTSIINLSGTQLRALISKEYVHVEEPKSYDEALTRPDAEFWVRATHEELESWRELGVYEKIHPSKIPRDAEIIDSKTVYKLKLDKNGNPARWKCRIVARGFQESDPGETFAPTASAIVIRLIVALAVKHGWKLRQADVKTAYLNATLPNPVYLRPPKGLEEPDGSYYILRKATYGLGASGRLWWQLFAEQNRNFGMEALTDDDTAWIVTRKKANGQKSTLIIAVVVDDCLMATDDEELRQEWLAFMQEHFQVSDDGDLEWFLGVNFERQQDGDIIAKQSAYIKRVLQRFKMDQASPKSTPMETTFAVDPEELPQTPSTEDLAEFRSILGCLIYASIWCYPEISYAVNYLARFAATPNKKLIKAAKRVLRYLKGVSDSGIVFSKHDRFDVGLDSLTVFADTSDADCTLTSKSTGGYIIYLNGSPIAWKSGRLPLVTLSSAESEYVQLTLASQEVIYIQEILKRAGYDQGPATIYEDNQAAIAITNNPCHRKRTRHIRRRYHWVRQCVQDKTIYVTYVPTDDNTADLFTKALPEAAFTKHRDQAKNLPRRFKNYMTYTNYQFWDFRGDS